MPRIGGVGVGPRAIYPRNWSAFADEFWPFDYDSMTATRTTLQTYGYFYSLIKAAAGAYLQKYVFLEAGDYYLYLLGVLAATAGITSCWLDGVQIGATQDWYAAVTTYNIIYPVVFTMPQSGRALLRWQVDGKNDASSGYRLLYTRAVVVIPDEG